MFDYGEVVVKSFQRAEFHGLVWFGVIFKGSLIWWWSSDLSNTSTSQVALKIYSCFSNALSLPPRIFHIGVYLPYLKTSHITHHHIESCGLSF